MGFRDSGNDLDTQLPVFTPFFSVFSWNPKKKKSRKSLTCRDLSYWYRLAASNLAERTGFEPVVPVTQYVSLANWWFQPLTHLS